LPVAVRDGWRRDFRQMTKRGREGANTAKKPREERVAVEAGPELVWGGEKVQKTYVRGQKKNQLWGKD